MKKTKILQSASQESSRVNSPRRPNLPLPTSLPIPSTSTAEQRSPSQVLFSPIDISDTLLLIPRAPRSSTQMPSISSRFANFMKYYSSQKAKGKKNTDESYPTTVMNSKPWSIKLYPNDNSPTCDGSHCSVLKKKASIISSLNPVYEERYGSQSYIMQKPSSETKSKSRSASRYRKSSDLTDSSDDEASITGAVPKSSARRKTRNKSRAEAKTSSHERGRKINQEKTEEDPYTLRLFSISKKGKVISHGDLKVIRRRAAQNFPISRSSSSSHSAGSSIHSNSLEFLEVTPTLKVLILGDIVVGKTSLISQFMTSEFINISHATNLGETHGNRGVTILLGMQNYYMIFIERSSLEMSVENYLATYEPHACVIVYSIESKSSYEYAVQTLKKLANEDFNQEKSVIIVGNKCDLAKSRVISEEVGKILADAYSCTFIETSCAIQYNVDELLINTLQQIKLKRYRGKNKEDKRFVNKLVSNIVALRDVIRGLFLKGTAISYQHLHNN